MTEGLPSLIKPTNTFPFLLIHVAMNGTARRNYKEITSDDEALGRKRKDIVGPDGLLIHPTNTQKRKGKGKGNTPGAKLAVKEMPT